MFPNQDVACGYCMATKEYSVTQRVFMGNVFPQNKLQSRIGFLLSLLMADCSGSLPVLGGRWPGVGRRWFSFGLALAFRCPLVCLWLSVSPRPGLAQRWLSVGFPLAFLWLAFGLPLACLWLRCWFGVGGVGSVMAQRWLGVGGVGSALSVLTRCWALAFLWLSVLARRLRRWLGVGFLLAFLWLSVDF